MLTCSLGTLKPNAFLEPDNPGAVFPQRKPENNIDFRSHAIDNSGLCGRHTNRSDIPGNRKKKPKYGTVSVKTKDELVQEEEEQELQKELEVKQKIKKEVADSGKLFEKMLISKRKHSDVDMDMRQSKMLAKDPDSIAIKKRKRGSRKGNKRTLVF